MNSDKNTSNLGNETEKEADNTPNKLLSVNTSFNSKVKRMGPNFPKSDNSLPNTNNIEGESFLKKESRMCMCKKTQDIGSNFNLKNLANAINKLNDIKEDARENLATPVHNNGHNGEKIFSFSHQNTSRTNQKSIKFGKAEKLNAKGSLFNKDSEKHGVDYEGDEPVKTVKTVDPGMVIIDNDLHVDTKESNMKEESPRNLGEVKISDDKYSYSNNNNYSYKQRWESKNPEFSDLTKCTYCLEQILHNNSNESIVKLGEESIIKYLRMVNLVFDDNATFSENDFLKLFLSKEEIIRLLKNTSFEVGFDSCNAVYHFSGIKLNFLSSTQNQTKKEVKYFEENKISEMNEYTDSNENLSSQERKYTCTEKSNQSSIQDSKSGREVCSSIESGGEESREQSMKEREKEIREKKEQEVKDYIVIKENPQQTKEGAISEETVPKPVSSSTGNLPQLNMNLNLKADYNYEGEKLDNKEDLLNQTSPNRKRIKESNINILDKLDTEVSPSNEFVLNLELRAEIIRFYRMMYIDVSIDEEKLEYYRLAVVRSPESLENENLISSEDNGSSKAPESLENENLISSEDNDVMGFLESIISISKDNNDEIDADLLLNEVKYYQQIIRKSRVDMKHSYKSILYYLEQGVFLPVKIFMNKFFSQAASKKGRDIIKVFQMIFYLLLLKREILKWNLIGKAFPQLTEGKEYEEGNPADKDKDKEGENQSNLKDSLPSFSLNTLRSNHGKTGKETKDGNTQHNDKPIPSQAPSFIVNENSFNRVLFDESDSILFLRKLTVNTKEQIESIDNEILEMTDQTFKRFDYIKLYKIVSRQILLLVKEQISHEMGDYEIRKPDSTEEIQQKIEAFKNKYTESFNLIKNIDEMGDYEIRKPDSTEEIHQKIEAFKDNYTESFNLIKKKKKNNLNSSSAVAESSPMERSGKLTEQESSIFKLLVKDSIYKESKENDKSTSTKERSLKGLKDKKEKLKKKMASHSPFFLLIELSMIYESQKADFAKSSIMSILDEIQIQYDLSLSNILLRYLFLVSADNSVELSTVSRNAYFIIFKLLQYDTLNTQKQMEAIINSTALKEKKDNEDSKNNVGAIIDFNLLANTFFKNILSVFLSAYNPTGVELKDDYETAYNLVKIFKMMSESSFQFIQGIIVKELKFSLGEAEVKITFYDFLLCVAMKIIVMSRWEKLNFEDREESTYLFEIFSAIIELLIEVVQGNSTENMNACLDYQKDFNEEEEYLGIDGRSMNLYRMEDNTSNTSSFAQRGKLCILPIFIDFVQTIMFDDKNDNIMIYKIRLNLFEFYMAFLEDSNCPTDIKNLIIDKINVTQVFESLKFTLRKLNVFLSAEEVYEKEEIKRYKERINSTFSSNRKKALNPQEGLAQLQAARTQYINNNAFNYNNSIIGSSPALHVTRSGDRRRSTAINPSPRNLNSRHNFMGNDLYVKRGSKQKDEMGNIGMVLDSNPNEQHKAQAFHLNDLQKLSTINNQNNQNKQNNTEGFNKEMNIEYLNAQRNSIRHKQFDPSEMKYFKFKDRVYSDFEFNRLYKSMRIDDEGYKFLMNSFYKDEEFRNEVEFVLCCSFFRYIKIIDIVYENTEVRDFMTKFEKEKEQDILEAYEALKQQKNLNSDGLIRDHINLNAEEHYENFLIIRIFNDITKVVEVQRGDDVSKIIFTINPEFSLISEESKQIFLNNLPIDSRFSKLSYLIDNSIYFVKEIEFFKSKPQNNWLSDLGFWINYEYVIVIIFLLGIVINLIMLAKIDGNFHYEVIDEATFNKLEFMNETNFHPLEESIDEWLPIYGGIGIASICLSLLITIIWLLVKLPLIYFNQITYYSNINKVDPNKLGFLIKMKILIAKCLFNSSFFLSMLIFNFFAIIAQSTYHGSWAYAFSLLIVFNISETIKNIIRALSVRWESLLAAYALFLTMMYFYSALAFFFLNELFAQETDEVVNHLCNTLLSCTLMFFDFGLRRHGGIGEVPPKVSYFYETDLYYGKFIYQVSYFIIVTVIIQNVVFGIIIDTFSELSNISAKTKYEKENICLICNAKREDLERLKVKFNNHINNDHDVWNYIQYMIKIMNSDPQDLTSVNNYAYGLMNGKLIYWFPSSKYGTEQLLGTQDNEEVIDEEGVPDKMEENEPEDEKN
eukprot:CAMPEP_0170537316 /NCGR_PEP_ID=MMETSP0209-20121228/102640_1 /TAXON_ID=665100 ORGANISM="Litonotus pictus, Strain P1" /NCGR_SAMPLE_ID=MMETSP0209 /ASSEMBLY_ACC=CAM_ASM_000301 /LENGTH=2133 /DNA_ID=CAMNT_0010838791 /DNA_START=300 /DNA_END=6703 /DNA_ORIENTATION=-